MPAAEFDEDFLEIAIERRSALSALAETPLHRRELQEKLDISKTTCHRIVRTFDDRGLLHRTDDGYALSEKGVLVAAETDRYRRNVRAACLLEPIASAFEETEMDFDLELFADARITRPEPDNPTVPINREFELFQDSETHRKVDYSQYIPPLYIEQLADIIVEEGMRFEHILPKALIEQQLSQFPELHKKQGDGTIEARTKYYACEEIPFGMAIYDRSHVVLRAYDETTGSIEVMVDTDDPDALAWAENVYQHFREKADPPAERDDLPDWTPHPDVDI